MGVGGWGLGSECGGRDRRGSGLVDSGLVEPQAEDHEIPPLSNQPADDANADLDSLIEWMFSLSPTERLAALQSFANAFGVDRGVGVIAFAPLAEESQP